MTQAAPDEETRPAAAVVERLQCKHVAAGAPYVAAIILESGKFLNEHDLPVLEKAILLARFCAECERVLRETLKSEPIGGVEPVG